ncbi:MAG: coproporphyrinogen-III oxidase family protein, partial [Planctomycetota bacterium]
SRKQVNLFAGERRPVQTLFIGGGTPTHLDPRRLGRLLNWVGQQFPPSATESDAYEFSVEANPSDLVGDVGQQRCQVLAHAGVNRVSMGVQSFDPRHLQTLQRDHHAEIVVDAIAHLRSVGITNVSIDLIFGVPDADTNAAESHHYDPRAADPLEIWDRDSARALQLPIQHLSTYALTFEKGTQFWNRQNSGRMVAIEESIEVAMYRRAMDQMRDAGWLHYEISSFAADPSKRCRHNINYWNGGGWYALGPGAAGFVDGKRTTNHRSPTTYIKRVLRGESPIAETETINHEQWARERAAFGIRRIDQGIDMAKIHRESGFDLAAACQSEIQSLIDQQWIERSDPAHPDLIHMTGSGILFADRVAEAFL